MNLLSQYREYFVFVKYFLVADQVVDQVHMLCPIDKTSTTRLVGTLPSHHLPRHYGQDLLGARTHATNTRALSD